MINIFYKNFIRDNIWTLLGHILIYAKGLILLPILIKLLGIEIYSSYVLILTSLGFIFGISSFGIGYSAKRHLPVTTNNEYRQQLFYSQFLLHFFSIVTLSLIIFLLRSTIQNWLSQEGIEITFWLIPFYLIFMLFYSQCTNFFRHTNRINLFNIGVVLMPYLNIGIVVIAILFDTDGITVNKLIIFQMIALGLIALPFLIKIIKELGLSLPTLKAVKIRDDLKLGFPLVLSYVVDTILSISDRYVIAFFIAVTAIGYYNPAYTLGSLIIFFPKVSGIVLPPLLSRAVDTGHKIEAKQLIDYTIKGFLLIAIPFVIGIYVLGKPLLAILANNEIANNAYYVTPIVAIGSVFYGLSLIMGNILFVQKKTTVIFWSNFVAATINLLLNIVLLLLFKNIVFAAITTLVSYFIAFIILLRSVVSEWKLDFQLAALFKSLIASIIMAIVLISSSSVFPVRKFGAWVILPEVLGGIMVYLGLVFEFKVFSKREMRYFLDVWKLGKKSS